MAFPRISNQALAAAGFSPPSQANSYYPKTIPPSHVHLGTPTTVNQQWAGDGYVWVTFVSLKVNGNFYARLAQNANGTFSATLPSGAAWPDGMYNAVNALGILQ